MSARRNISQRTAPPTQQQNIARPVATLADAVQKQDGPIDVKKMHPMAVISLHEDRLNDIDAKITQLMQNQTKKTNSDESSMIAECIKQIKFLTQENQTNRNLARELTLELLRLKTSLQEDGKIEMRISDETRGKYETFKENANANANANPVTTTTSSIENPSQSVRDELMLDGDTVSFSGNGSYDPNAL